MPKRGTKWKPDIYDMTAGSRGAAGEPAESSDTAAVAAVVAGPEAGDVAVAPTVVVPVPRHPTRPGDNSGLLGLVAGAVVGAALTLLVAPTSGARLRAFLRARLEQQTQVMAQKMPNTEAWGHDTPAAVEQAQP